MLVLFCLLYLFNDSLPQALQFWRVTTSWYKEKYNKEIRISHK